jgi:hypothetical protein
MKKLLVILLLIAAYFWVVSTGHEQFVLDQSKRLCQAVTTWISDTNVDIRVHDQPPPAPIKKHRPRRWD